MDTPEEGKEARTLTHEEKKEYHALSIKDLLEARDAYHVFLMRKKNVIGTAIGKIRKRKKGVPPSEPKTLENTEVWSEYAWPCVLVFVQNWISDADFGKGGEASYDDYLPRALYLPDGREIPVCVLESRWQARKPDAIAHMKFPGSAIAGGYPVLTRVQGQDRWATLSCLVSDGRITYALTNAHVAGKPGEELVTLRGGNEHVIGRAAERQLRKAPFSQVYESFAGKHALLNLDIGLIELDDLDGVSAQVYGIGELKGIVDVNHDTLSLKLIGRPVMGYGCASGLMKGEITALFYRYASAGGYEYIADYLIGPRPLNPGDGELPFSPRNGDSGTLLVVDDPQSDLHLKAMGVLWGGQKHVSDQKEQPYALVTNLATICRMLDLELVCHWNIGYDRYFGAYAHTVLPSLAAGVIADEKLNRLMVNNAGSFAMPLGETEVKQTHGLSGKVFVPLCDVPDLVWKSRSGKFKRGKEGPNHFADMDQPDPANGNQTLLDLCEDPQNIDPAVWEQFYKDVKADTKGLLPFRVAQIYAAMVHALQAGQKTEFVGAAGVLTHYIFDACMPLHISRLYNGNPDPDAPTKTIQEGKKTKQVPLAYGVHDEFDNSMVEYHQNDLRACLPGLVQEKDQADAPVAAGVITTPRSAAAATVKLMRHTFQYANPADIVKDYEGLVDETKRDRCAALWTRYGGGMQQAMAEGVVLLARLWQAAWDAGDGAQKIGSSSAVPEPDLIELYETKEGFLDSVNIAEIKSAIAWDG